jgi:hypothetical protein
LKQEFRALCVVLIFKRPGGGVTVALDARRTHRRPSPPQSLLDYDFSY